MPIAMVTCPTNTFIHQRCSHEGKLQGLVWLARAGLQNNLWFDWRQQADTWNSGEIALFIFFKRIFNKPVCMWMWGITLCNPQRAMKSFHFLMISRICLSVILFVCVLVREWASVIPALSLCFLPQDRGGSLNYPELCETAGHPYGHRQAAHVCCVWEDTWTV